MKISVTKTYLPPLDEYMEQLRVIWETEQVTNNGPVVKELECRLKDYLGVKHLFLTANGTLGLQIALRALNISKKIITTPFSYVASTGSILWEHATPVFADINSFDYCINPEKVEAAIDDETQGILAVHVYGYACDINTLGNIARQKGIKIIYDAAHAFGSCLEDKSLASFGDISVLSFHATKLFHTIEGGAIVTNDDELAQKIGLYRSFGHISDEYFSLGINAKNSELHAAMGLCMLPRIPKIIEHRYELCTRYDSLLESLPLARPIITLTGFKYNYAYYPVVFPSEKILLHTKSHLEENDIYPRRYFYPSLNQLPYHHGEQCPIAEGIASRVLCLPLSHIVTQDIQERIAEIIKKCIIK